MTRRLPLFLPLATLLCFGPACDDNPPNGDQLEPVISALPATVFLGTQVSLDASETEGSFNLTWRVEEPAGCDRSAPLGPTDIATTFEALCVGVHTVRLEVTPVGGDELFTAEETFEVVLPDGFLELSVANIDEATLGNDARVTFNFDATQIPESLIGDDLLEVSVTLGENATAEPTITPDPNDPKAILVNMAEAHATYDLEVFLVIADGELRSATPATVSLTTLNSNPEVATITVAAFAPGESTTVTAEASDADGDTVTCALQFAADNVGPEFTLPAPDTSGDCAFTLSPPDGLLAWRLEIVATDDFGGQDDDANPFVLTPNNAPPAIAALAVGDRVEVNYTCNGSTCSSDSVNINVVATDDIDAADALTYEIVDVTGAGAGEIEVVAGAGLGEFTVRAKRADVGALAGEYSLEVRVTEATSAPGLDPSTSVEELTFAVLNDAPAVANLSAPDVNHSFSNNIFSATLAISFSADDNQNNANGRVTLTGCPGDVAISGTTCGEVTFDAIEKEGESVTFSLSSPSITALVGAFDLSVVAFDADGETDTELVTVSVLNRAPVAAASVNVPQIFDQNSGLHRATLIAVTDPDGDPLTGLNVACPNDNCVGTQTTVAGGVIVDSAPVANFLGAYTFTGEVTDGIATTTTNVTLTVTNAAPVLTGNAGGSTGSRNHLTAGGLVSVDIATDGSGFPLAGTATDANGDPLTVEMVDPDYFIADGATATFFPGNFNSAFDTDMPYSEFQAGFNVTNNSMAFTAAFRLVDPFGSQSGTFNANATFLNRLPSTPTFGANTGWTDDNDGIDDLRFHISNAVGNISIVEPELQDGNASVRKIGISHIPCNFAQCDEFIPFDVETNSTDPDGDPLELRHTASCGFDTVRLPNNNFINFTANRKLRFQVEDLQGCSPNPSVLFVQLIGDELRCTVTATVRDVNANNPRSAGITDIIKASADLAPSTCF